MLLPCESEGHSEFPPRGRNTTRRLETTLILPLSPCYFQRNRTAITNVSKASEELLGQNAGLRALRLFETKTEELLRRRALGTIGIRAEELTLKKHIRLTPPSPKMGPDLGPNQSGGFCVSGLCASHVRSMDSSRRATDGRLLKYGQSSKGSRAIASNA